VNGAMNLQVPTKERKPYPAVQTLTSEKGLHSVVLVSKGIST
jgi:hypothetical protein